MKIQEITRVHTGGVNLDKIDRSNEQEFGFNGVVDIYPMKKNIIGDNWVYYLLENDKIIAGVVTTPNQPYLQINGVFVNPKYCGQKLGMKMYHSIRHNESMNLIGDTQQTTEGRKVWDQIAKGFDVVVMDMNTGEIVSRNVEDAYKNYDADADNLVLVTEGIIPKLGLQIPHLKIKK